MFDFHERRKLRNIVYSKPILFILGVAVIFFSYSVWGAFQKERETITKKNQREDVLNELQERKDILIEEIDSLKTDRGIEAEIREKFEVANEGENIIIIVDPPESDVADFIFEEKSIWEKFLNIF